MFDHVYVYHSEHQSVYYFFGTRLSKIFTKEPFVFLLFCYCKSELNSVWPLYSFKSLYSTLSAYQRVMLFPLEISGLRFCVLDPPFVVIHPRTFQT